MSCCVDWRGGSCAEDGVEEVLELVVAAEGDGNADPSADDGEDGEDDERAEHDPGGFVDAVGGVASSGRLPG